MRFLRNLILNFLPVFLEQQRESSGGNIPVPPPGFRLVVDHDESYVIDENGDFLIAQQ